MSWLNGRKTYVGLILAGILGFVGAQGWLEPEMVAGLGALVASFTGVAIKHAIDKRTNK